MKPATKHSGNVFSLHAQNYTTFHSCKGSTYITHIHENVTYRVILLRYQIPMHTTLYSKKHESVSSRVHRSNTYIVLRTILTIELHANRGTPGQRSFCPVCPCVHTANARHSQRTSNCKHRGLLYASTRATQTKTKHSFWRTYRLCTAWFHWFTQAHTYKLGSC
jgi:hypothetical protein